MSQLHDKLADSFRKQGSSSVDITSKLDEIAKGFPTKLSNIKSQATLLATTKEGLTGIGSPAYLNISLHHINLPDPDPRPIEARLIFDDIESHKGNLNDLVKIKTYDEIHHLRRCMQKTSWNNIPLPLKEMIEVLIDDHIRLDIKMQQRKSVTNERILQLQTKVQHLQDQQILALIESRQMGLFMMAREGENDQRVGAIVDQKLQPHQSQLNSLDVITKRIQERLSQQNKQVNEKIKTLDDFIDDKLLKLNNKVERIQTELGEEILDKAMEKFKQLQTIQLDSDGRVIPPDMAFSKHKKLSLKEYTLDCVLSINSQILKTSETLESMVKDVREWTAQNFDETQKQTNEKVLQLVEKDQTVMQEVFNFQELASKQQNETQVIADEVAKIRAEIEGLIIKQNAQARLNAERKEAERKQDESSNSPVKIVQKLQNISTMGQNQAVTSLQATLESKILAIEKKFDKLKDEFVPQKLKQQMDIVEEKFKLSQTQIKIDTKKKIEPVIKSTDVLLHQIKEIGNHFQTLKTEQTQMNKKIDNLNNRMEQRNKAEQERVESQVTGRNQEYEKLNASTVTPTTPIAISKNSNLSQMQLPQLNKLAVTAQLETAKNITQNNQQLQEKVIPIHNQLSEVSIPSPVAINNGQMRLSTQQQNSLAQKTNQQTQLTAPATQTVQITQAQTQIVTPVQTVQMSQVQTSQFTPAQPEQIKISQPTTHQTTQTSPVQIAQITPVSVQTAQITPVPVQNTQITPLPIQITQITPVPVQLANITKLSPVQHNQTNQQTVQSQHSNSQKQSLVQQSLQTTTPQVSKTNHANDQPITIPDTQENQQTLQAPIVEKNPNPVTVQQSPELQEQVRSSSPQNVSQRPQTENKNNIKAEAIQHIQILSQAPNLPTITIQYLSEKPLTPASTVSTVQQPLIEQKEQSLPQQSIKQQQQSVHSNKSTQSVASKKPNQQQQRGQQKSQSSIVSSLIPKPAPVNDDQKNSIAHGSVVTQRMVDTLLEQSRQSVKRPTDLPLNQIINQATDRSVKQSNTQSVQNYRMTERSGMEINESQPSQSQSQKIDNYQQSRMTDNSQPNQTYESDSYTKNLQELQTKMMNFGDDNKVTEESEDQIELTKMLIQSKINDEIGPLKSEVLELKEKVTDQEETIKKLTLEIEKVDTHYMHCCRAICSTQGLVLKDVSGHNIQQEFIKRLVQAEEMRARLKLHGVKENQNLDDLQFQTQVIQNRNSSEDDPYTRQRRQRSQKETECQSSRGEGKKVPLLIDLKSKKINIGAALPQNQKLAANQFSDSDGERSPERQLLQSEIASKFEPSRNKQMFDVNKVGSHGPQTAKHRSKVTVKSLLQSMQSSEQSIRGDGMTNLQITKAIAGLAFDAEDFNLEEQHQNLTLTARLNNQHIKAQLPDLMLQTKTFGMMSASKFHKKGSSLYNEGQQVAHRSQVKTSEITKRRNIASVRNRQQTIVQKAKSPRQQPLVDFEQFNL